MRKNIVRRKEVGNILIKLEPTEELMARVVLDAIRERRRQESKWGEQNHIPSYWYSILGEEFGEVGKEVNNYVFDNSDTDKYREELIQVAAVALAAVECLDRGKWNGN